MKKIAIIGSGLSGLTVANLLNQHADITLFEKSRGVGGRMATRRAEPYHFDHGAQFFKANSQAFLDFLAPLLEQGVVSQWHARFAEFSGHKMINQRHWANGVPHYVPQPGMNAMAKVLSHDLNVQCGIEVRSMVKTKNGWQLFDTKNNRLGNYDWVICTAPAEQTAKLLPKSFCHYNDVASKTMQACFSLMLGFRQPCALDFDAALIHDSDISWISVNNTKPNRKQSFSLLVHANNQWATDHIDDNLAFVHSHLSKLTSDTIGVDVSLAQHQAIHRWRYANIEKQAGDTFLIDHQAQLIACGDWCIEGRIEAAFSSGASAAHELLKHWCIE